MKPTVEQEARMWLEQAEADYSSLRILLNAKKYDLVCFLSQQVAEKALKAFLFSRGEEMIFSHSIIKLCDLAAASDRAFAQLKKEIKGLTSYYVEARYPNALEEIPARFFDKKDAEQAIKMAESTLEAVKAKLSK